MFKDLKVNDVVYLVQNDRRHLKPQELKVNKIGRKYITLENGQRFEEWDYDGFAIGNSSEFPHAKIYKNKNVYDEMAEWDKFTHLFSGFSKPVLSREKRKAILEIYNSDLGDK